MVNKFIFFIILIIFTLIYLEFNTRYTIVNKMPSFKKGTLFIGTHNYEHKDIFVTLKHFSNIKDKFYMLFANKYWNHLLEPFRPPNIEFMFVKSKTVDNISSRLLLENNVIMYLYNETPASGPFYIIKNTNCPLIFLKIKSDNKIINHYNTSYGGIYINNLMNKFTIEFKKIKFKINDSTDSNIFMKQLKHLLYS